LPLVVVNPLDFSKLAIPLNCPLRLSLGSFFKEKLVIGLSLVWRAHTVPVGQGQHFHAEYLFILRKLVSAEAKNRIILEDSCFRRTKKFIF
jgi:hypothetical protein